MGLLLKPHTFHAHAPMPSQKKPTANIVYSALRPLSGTNSQTTLAFPHPKVTKPCGSFKLGKAATPQTPKPL